MKYQTQNTLCEYEDTGSGPPLLLIHGFPHDGTLWRLQIEELKNHARLIIPDLRGFGKSGDAPETMTMDDYAADLKALIDAQRIRGVILCGLSMGGYISLAFLDRYPELVLGLILANTRSAPDTEQARAGRQAMTEQVLSGGVAGIATTMLPKMLTATTIARNPDLADSVRVMMARQRVNGVVAALRGMAARPDRTPILDSIKIPTLIITGEADSLIPMEESQSINEAIEGSRLLIIPQAAHLSNLEAPDVFNQAVIEFLEAGRFQST